MIAATMSNYRHAPWAAKDSFLDICGDVWERVGILLFLMWEFG